MRQKNARTLVELRLQSLLWEYITCLEQYYPTLYQRPKGENAKLLLQRLDHFITILKTLRMLLQIINEESWNYSSSRKEK